MRILEFIKRRPNLSAVVGGGAAALLTVGAYTATACSCVTAFNTTTTTTTTISTTTGGGGSLGGVTTADFWITKPGDSPGTCQRLSPAGAYNQAKSCGGSQFLNTAISTASPGDTIGWPGGTYTGAAQQTIDYESRLHATSCDPLGTWGTPNTAACIRIAPQNGTQIILPANVEIHAGALWFDGSATGSITTASSRTFSFRNIGYMGTEGDDPQTSSQFPDRVTITGWAMDSAEALGTDKIRFSQTDIGGWMFNSSNGCGAFGATDFATGDQLFPIETNISGRNNVPDTNIVFDHTYFHTVNDNTPAACPSDQSPHGGCMFIHNGVNSALFDSDVWEECWVYDIQIQGQGGGGVGTPATGVTIQNNWFGTGVDAYRNTGNLTTPAEIGVQFDAGTWTNWLLRFNSFDENQTHATLCQTGGCAWSNFRMIGNAGFKPDVAGNNGPCGASGVTSSQNAWIGGTCGASDATASSPLFVSNTVGSMNLALQPPGPTAADNLVTGTTGDFNLSYDINGAARTPGSADAGAVER